jgi:SAM-dependent methyltransferase
LSRALPAAVALISGAALAYEILLIRLFSIAEWHHLAFLIISLALLGYGASGTLLALAREPLLRRFDLAASAFASAFAAMSLGAFLIAQRIELNSLEIFWSTRQFGRLFLLYLLFAVPFFCAATAIGLALTKFGADTPRLYRADLIGGGASAAAATALLFVIHPVTALQLVSILGFIAAALFKPRAFAVAIAGVAAAIAVGPLARPLRMSQFKELSHALRIPEARILEERSSPHGLLTVVASPAVPFRHAPGLSLSFAGEIPEQIGIFTDGGGMTPVVQGGPREYLDYLPTAVAYHAGTKKQRVAVIGAGGGAEVLSALDHGAANVTAVELNPQLIELARKHGAPYEHPRVHVVTSEARKFIHETRERYDAIQIALVGSHGASAAGVQALSESYLYTVESMQELVARLRPGGHLVITRWMQAPPRDIVKLLATAIAAGESAGVRPANRIALIRGWNTATLIVKAGGDFAPGELAAIRRFCDDRSLDVDYAPGIRRGETNQYNVLDEPYLFDAAAALLAGGRAREDYYERYKFNIRPATDERPYFFHSFRWSALPELLRLRARGGVPLLEWGYLVLVAGLAQALAASVVLILLPLVFLRRTSTHAPTWRLVLYFGSIGLAFLFMEIAFMQRLTLFLGEPLYAIAVVLASFLVFGGLGSGASARFDGSLAAPRIAVCAFLAMLIAAVLPSRVIGLPDLAKIAIGMLVIAPLAFMMGMPFPNGLRKLHEIDIPWAWGINGTASVLSSMLATLIAVHFGFTWLVASAVLLYALAGQQLSRIAR